MHTIPPIRQLNKTYLFTLVGIMLTATGLRVCGWLGMPYQHDELSALYRLNVDSLSDLFRQGIMVDGHPALVQCFLYVWTSLVGTSEWIVKLPFVVCGIASVYLAWRLIYAWSSPAAALYGAAFIAVLQLPVFHSLHARPYAPGMLLLLWFALVWTRFQQENHPSKKRYALYILAALLCAWCHHFTALGAVLLGMIGFFTLKKNQLKSYFVANALVILVYLPYLPVTLAQLQYGGLGGDSGWLQSPDVSFPIDYLRHVFMYSPLVLFALAFAILRSDNEILFEYKWKTVALLMFLLPLLIGLFYSWYVSPILQYSLLVFFLPFLFIFLFPTGKKPVSANWQSAATFIILVTGVLTLFIKRHYYELAHTSVFRDAFTLTEECVQGNRLKKEEGLFVFNENRAYLDFYNTHKLPYISYLGHSTAPLQFTRLLQETNKSYVILANPGSDLLAAARARYDFTFILKQSFNCEIYYAGDELISYAPALKPVKKIPILSKGITALEPHTMKWVNYNHLHQSSAVYYVPAEEEFSLALKGNMQTLHVQYSDLVEIRAVFEIPDTGYSLEKMPLLVFDFKDNDSTYFWKSGWAIENKLNKEVYAVCMVRGSDVTSDRDFYLEKTFGVSLWNLHHTPFRLKKWDMMVSPGNDKLYGVTSEIQK